MTSTVTMTKATQATATSGHERSSAAPSKEQELRGDDAPNAPNAIERDATVTAAPKKKRAPVVFVGLVLAASAIGAGVWLTGRGKESTDDAFVEAHVASVAARLQGQVLKVNVKDNDLVEVGQVLVVLDDRDAKVRVTTAEADLMSAKANLSAMQTQLALTEKSVDANLRQAKGSVVQASALARSSHAGIDQARADVDAAESRRRLAELELKRAEKLHADGATPQADYDAKKAVFDQAVATVALARAREQSAIVGISNAAGGIESAQGRLVAAQAGPEQIEAARAAVAVAEARVAQSEAALEQAKLNLSYTEVKALVRGVVSRRSVEVGQLVDPARPLMAITALSDVWVVANFKEDQIAEMYPGQSAKVTVDTFRGRQLRAHVDSLAGGSGARFSLLPADNASGNFTKVVQRIPVLVRFDEPLPAGMTLRPGMSAYVTVTTGGTTAGAQTPHP